MKPHPVLPALLGLALITGCGEKKASSDAPATNSTSSGNPITAPVDYLGAVAKAQKSTTSKLSMVGITQGIQAYQAQEGHLPKTLNDLVTAGVIGKLPDPPTGMKFNYDPKTGDVTVVPK
jgi:hypothetical protein